MAGDLAVSATPIPGLLVLDLPVHGDNRGWFKENWQRRKMVALGLPDFHPVQNNISYNRDAGVARGIHAEPWDKFVSVATGRVFGAWVDLREGPSFGAVFTTEVGPGRAVFVPRGVGNAYQTLEPGTAYTYLVNEHWSPDASYTFLNLADETAAIAWPIPLAGAELSDKDRAHPRLAQVVPFPARRVLVLGAGGQVGRALRGVFGARADYLGRAECDLAEPGWTARVDWARYDTVVNAAAYTAVDAAETRDGRQAAWAVNVGAAAELAAVARQRDLALVHYSTDYVFDGTATEPYREDAPVAPLGVYAQTKAAADTVVATVPCHYILRTSWVVGDGPNFVRTMLGLAARGVCPQVVDDQHGRLTFAADLAAGAAHLLASGAAPGVYNLTGGGPATTWHSVARRVFALAGRDPADVAPVSTADYLAGRPAAPRPAYSVLDLGKVTATGFAVRDGDEALAEYVRSNL